MTDAVLDELLNATAAFEEAKAKAKAATQEVNKTRAALLDCELKVRAQTSNETRCWVYKGYVILCQGTNGLLSILSPSPVATDEDRDF